MANMAVGGARNMDMPEDDEDVDRSVIVAPMKSATGKVVTVSVRCSSDHSIPVGADEAMCIGFNPARLEVEPRAGETDATMRERKHALLRVVGTEGESNLFYQFIVHSANADTDKPTREVMSSFRPVAAAECAITRDTVRGARIKLPQSIEDVLSHWHDRLRAARLNNIVLDV